MSQNAFDWLGKTLAGRYTVDKQLGAGGMGMVLRAFDHNLDTNVVVKVPHRAMLQDPEFVSRFSHEVRSLVTLSHPHVVSVLDVGEHDGVPFAVMRYLPGGDLKDRQPRDSNGAARPQELLTLLDWLEDVAEALDFIHSQGYVHRDIKPDNILFDGAGNAYVGDFGIVKVLDSALEKENSPASLTQKGVALGTPEYMAPEVAMGEDYDGRADQYALAATVFEVLCGRPPFQGSTPAAIIVKSTTESAPNPALLVPTVPDDIAQCLLTGLARDPHDRYESCSQLAGKIIRRVKKHSADQLTNEMSILGEAFRAAQSGRPADAESQDATATAEDRESSSGMATPPPITVRQREVDCPGCGHRFSTDAGSVSAVSCPKCNHRFSPTAGKPGSSPTVPGKETSRAPSETVRQPPPVPTGRKQKRKAKPKHKRQSRQSQRSATGKAAASPTANTPQAGGNASNRRAESPTGATQKQPGRSKPQSTHQKPKQSQVSTDPTADLEPPTVHPDEDAVPQTGTGGDDVGLSYEDGTPRQSQPGRAPAPPPARTKPQPQSPAAAPQAGGRTRDRNRRRSNPPPPQRKAPSGPAASRGRSSRPPRPSSAVGEAGRQPKRSPVGLVLKILLALVMVGATCAVVAFLWIQLRVKDVVVDAGGSGDYTTIREAVEQSPPGTRITIREGRYREDRLTLDKPLMIEGDDREKVRIEVRSTVLISHGDVKLRKLTIIGKSDTSEDDKKSATETAAVRNNTKRPRRRVVLPTATLLQRPTTKTDSKNGQGKESGSSSSYAPDLGVTREAGKSAVRITDGTPTIANCNISSEDGSGIIVESKGAQPTITNCRIHDCKESGLYFTNKASGRIRGCTLDNNRVAGVYVDDGEPTIAECRISGGQLFGIRAPEGTVLIEDCDIRESKYGGVSSDAKAEITMRKCRITGGGRDGLRLFGEAKVYQTKLDDHKNDGVLVARLGDVLLRDCTITNSGRMGGYIAGTAKIEGCTISGQKDNGIEVASKGGNARIVRTQVSEGGKTGIAVFGKAHIENCTITNPQKRGIEVAANAEGVIIRTKVRETGDIGIAVFGKVRVDNQCEITNSGHYGLYVHYEGGTAQVTNTTVSRAEEEGVQCFGTLVLTDCVVEGNKGSGVKVQRRGDATLRKTRIRKNYDVDYEDDPEKRTKTKQAGIWVLGKATVENCVIEENKFAGITVDSTAEATIRKTHVESNDGRGIWAFGTVTVEDCDVRDNQVAGVSVYGGKATVTDSRINGHSPFGVFVGYSTKPGGKEKQYGYASVRNCDLRGNKNATGKSETQCRLYTSSNRE